MLTRNVNGVDVELTPEEEAAVRAEWAEAEKARANAPQPRNLLAELDALKAQLAALLESR